MGNKRHKVYKALMHRACQGVPVIKLNKTVNVYNNVIFYVRFTAEFQWMQQRGKREYVREH